MLDRVNVRKKTGKKTHESGIALLLSIFVLLLVCVVGIAMLSASGTESSLTGNYRSATAVYYAALSGLEEGRGRLLPRNPNYLGTSVPPPLLPLGNVIYIANPDASSLTAYPDTEYAVEFGSSPYNPPSNVQIVPSAPTITSPPNTPNPLYKWVRINALTECALRINVNNSGGGGGGCPNGAFNPTAMVYFDGTNLTRTATQYQPLGVTALAALPDGSRKLLQYVVAPVTLKVPVAAALTLASPGTIPYESFNPPSSANSFYIKGADQSGNGGLVCAPQPDLPAVGVYNLQNTNGDYNSVYNSLTSPPPKASHYSGAGIGPPSLSNVSPSNSTVDMTDPFSLSNFVLTIQNTADSVVTGPATGSDMPGAMSPSNPMTVVVNGDLTLTGYTGYGLLLVTGKLIYSGDSGWKGIVLVIGQGFMEEVGSADGGEFDGMVFIANTTGGGGGGGGGGVSLGPATYIVSSPGGKGIYYDSCWIANALKPVSYKVLAFHEIPYP